jgi:hypothetical protein
VGRRETEDRSLDCGTFGEYSVVGRETQPRAKGKTNSQQLKANSV